MAFGRWIQTITARRWLVFLSLPPARETSLTFE
jgi:hypothetical protein